ncbi:hypothetical protein BDZ89DRAFT_1118101 [Hymenopellis radicata]|nr:hypothetical protein BDZ89DRAFT_1118101 [Hymenopellis radicata]
MPWQLIASLIATYIITFIVQTFYGIRVYKVTRRNKLIFGIICIISLVQIAAGTAFVAEEVTADQPTVIVKNTTTLMLEVASTVVCMHCATDRLLHRLVIYAINMGLIGCLVALVQLIIFAAHRDQMLFLGANLVVSKCYSNSLLATLNARHSIRKAHDEWVDDENTQGIVLHRVGKLNPLSRLALRRSGKKFVLKYACGVCFFWFSIVYYIAVAMPHTHLSRYPHYA